MKTKPLKANNKKFATMLAQRELQQWLEQHRQLDNEADRKKFFQSLIQKLENKAENELQEGLIALLAAVRSTRAQAENKEQTNASFHVFPKSKEEQELLKQLLDRMAIPFKMSA